MLSSVDVKFIFDSVRLGLFSSADILQIADVTLRVVFLPCFSLLFRLVLTLTQPRPQVFSVNGALTCKKAALLVSSAHITQNWSSVTGYGELCVCF